MSTFWSLWVIGLTIANLILVFWVLMGNRKVAISDADDPENKTTGHVYDGIEEYDNPLPKWWFQLFLGTIVFTVIYLILYPGLGNWKGVIGWTQVNQLDREQEQAEQNYQEAFGAYTNMPIEEVALEPRAVKMGLRLFANNCAVCHGADGGGNFGFPNLTDSAWLYGGTPEKIKETITHGRNGQMPAWGSVIGEENVNNVAEHVLALSDRQHDAERAAKGAKVFSQNCVVCHGADGRGNQILGAPNLTDNIWLYGDSPEEIRQTIRAGRFGAMPAQKDKLKDEKIHLLAAYVYSLSLEQD